MEIEEDKIASDIADISAVRRRVERLKTLESAHIFYHFGAVLTSAGGISFLVNRW